ncbi:MAG TPA: hypothetical protein VL181_03980, partial [Holophagaceae bacterium]|nr:hypothetical protein [Holophagaceae bacterium]
AAAIFLAPALFMGAQPARHRPPMGELFMALPEAIKGDDGLGQPKERLALASRNVLDESHDYLLLGGEAGTPGIELRVFWKQDGGYILAVSRSGEMSQECDIFENRDGRLQAATKAYLPSYDKGLLYSLPRQGSAIAVMTVDQAPPVTLDLLQWDGVRFTRRPPPAISGLYAQRKGKEVHVHFWASGAGSKLQEVSAHAAGQDGILITSANHAFKDSAEVFEVSLPEEAPESDRVIVAIKDENGREQNAVVSISDSENP